MDENVTRQDEVGLFPRLHQRTQYSITVQWTYIRDDEWMPVDHFLLEYNSSKKPEVCRFITKFIR